MLSLYTRFKVWQASEEGATAVEYGIMVALIAVIVIGGVTLLGQRALATFNAAAAGMP